MVQRLLRAGASPSLRYNDKQEAAEIALSEGHLDVFNELVAANHASIAVGGGFAAQAAARTNVLHGRYGLLPANLPLLQAVLDGDHDAIAASFAANPAAVHATTLNYVAALHTAVLRGNTQPSMPS